MQVNEWTVEVIRRAYCLDGDNQQWLANLADVVQKGVDHALGSIAFLFRTCVDGHVVPLGFTIRGPTLTYINQVLHVCAHMQADERARFADTVHGVGSLREHDLLQTPVLINTPGPRFTDCFGLFTKDIDGTGCALLYPLSDNIASRRAKRWQKILPHIATGFRQRRARNARAYLNGQQPSPAVPLPSTRRDVSDLWRQLTLSMDASCQQPDAAGRLTALYDALLDGRWSLLRHFSHERRRYILLRQLSPESSIPLALTIREKLAVKLAINAAFPDHRAIGQAMNCKESTAATHLARAMKKVGVRSRAELIATLHTASVNHQVGASFAPEPLNAVTRSESPVRSISRQAPET